MSTINEFLSGKTLFVTGSTGFVGKGLVEKILRQVPDVGRIYLFIRPRSRTSGNPLDAEDRLRREILGSSAFSELRRRNGDRFEEAVASKLVAVPGDLTHDRLGIDPILYEEMTQEVDIVVSIAATVVFDEPVDLALNLNVLGPQRLVELARACRDAVLLHVSTAYVNGQLGGSIPETQLLPYETVAHRMGDGSAPDYDLESEIESIRTFSAGLEEESRREALQDAFVRMLDRQDRGKRVTEYRRTHQLEALRRRWIHKQLVDEGMRRARHYGWHDSYTLTKAMGEQIITMSRGDLPTAIVRPSIIESSLVEPEPGWVEDLKVADPLIAHYGKGRLPGIPGDPSVVLDLIPVDIVVNALIAILPRIRENGELKIYHVATGSRNPLRLGEITELVYDYFKQNPMVDRKGEPIAVKRWRFTSPAGFRRRANLKYRLPLKTLGWLMDALPFLPWSSRFRRRLSVLEATLERVLALSDTYSPYTHLNCCFDTRNTLQVLQELSEEDRQAFDFDVSRIKWPEYIQEIHIPGLKRHVLKAPDAAASRVPTGSIAS
ncbi:MAG: SDR family oxidoreductase [Candidatus Latescibacteria bacterium]|jgi:nucleoside-diphosphate-sugar epimerase|nr:SDR family oxidoreductase [Candidatus Latescibacterota bacterium]